MATMVNAVGDVVPVAQFYAAMYWGKYDCWTVTEWLILIPQHRLRSVHIVRTVVHRVLAAMLTFLPGWLESRLFKVTSTL